MPDKEAVRIEAAPAAFQGAPYRLHVGDVPPAQATIEVSALPSGALVEIEAIALA